MTLKLKSKSLNNTSKNTSSNSTQDLDTNSAEHDSQEHEIRVQKVKEIQEQGTNPWPVFSEKLSNSKIIKQEFQNTNQDTNQDTENKKEYNIAGRLMTIRVHGKTAFAHLQDNYGKVQIYIRQDIIGQEAFDFFKDYIDIGDIVACTGTSFKTKTGEISLKVQKFKLLSKSLHPLPEKFHGLTNIETKYRQRYLDLITNPESKQRFIKRSSIIKSIRNFLDSNEYIEVETPMLHPIAGGAAAKPFITHHNTLSSDFYLRIAPELYLKRLVVAGFDKVYEINRNFRNEGVSTRHNPEFTMLEFYTAYKDYNFAMDFVEKLFRNTAQETFGKLKFEFGDYLLDFSVPFEKISVKDAVKKYGNLQESDLSGENIDSLLNQHKIKLANKSASLGEKIYALFEELVEPKLIQPTFIIDFPIEVSPLAKRSLKDPSTASRFELFIAGMEIANSFNELNDPFDQAKRFYEQLKAHEAGDEEAHQFDADFVKTLEYGLPPTVGVGIGIDRLVMLLTNTTSIKEVILFPTLKKK